MRKEKNKEPIKKNVKQTTLNMKCSDILKPFSPIKINVSKNFHGIYNINFNIVKVASTTFGNGVVQHLEKEDL